MNGRALAEAGLFATAHPRASVRESLAVPGTADHERVLTARLFDALEFEVLPSRGFDIGDTWYRGVPISWFSPVRDGRALPTPSGEQWLTRFTGGLLTTCGFGTIGPPAGGEGMHGTASHLPADEVSWQIGEDGIRLQAVVRSIHLFRPSFQVRRTIVTGETAGMSGITVTDAVTNVGPEPAALSLMYHLNLGAPLVAPGSSVSVNSERVVSAEPSTDVPDWRVLPHPVPGISQTVFAHEGARLDAGGLARATVASSVRDLAAVIEWSGHTLPHLHQWVFPTRGRWALGIEPATAPLFGPQRDAPHAGAPLLSPGETRTHEVRISIGTREQAAADSIGDVRQNREGER